MNVTVCWMAFHVPDTVPDKVYMPLLKQEAPLTVTVYFMYIWTLVVLTPVAVHGKLLGTPDKAQLDSHPLEGGWVGHVRLVELKISSVDEAGERTLVPKLTVQPLANAVPDPGEEKAKAICPLRVWLVVTMPQLAAEAIDGTAIAPMAAMAAASTRLFFIVLIIWFQCSLCCVHWGLGH